MPQVAISQTIDTDAIGIRRLHVKHATQYCYDSPIQRSCHRIHLWPIHDSHQHLLDYRLTVTPDVPVIDYEDVFGNWASRFEINQPYTQLSIVAESTVELVETDPFAFAKGPIRQKFPLHWMPWELKMLTPYLSPIELPETKLSELRDYGMSFVERNQHDLIETLFDMNLTLFRDYTYVPGSSSLETTPYDVYVNKKGVCQDFANLFICLARLLNIPARYVCGYVHTGNNGGSFSDASHAWLQLYIANVGWKGFDPTNGTLPCTDHVRMAVGRHYRDTAPTAGTLNSNANERMTIDVELTEVNSALRHSG